jgi:RNA polymerase sigma-54 factor
MAMELRLVPKLSQQLVMTPQLKMAIKLLTLNHLELRDAVSAELVDNPVLEETYEDQGPSEREREDSGSAEKKDTSNEVVIESVGTETQKDNASEIDWENYLDSNSYLPPAAGSGRDNQFDGLPGVDQTLTRAETLEEHLVWQIRMSDMNGLEVQIALRLIGEMGDDGFLDRTPIQAPPPLEEAEAKKNGEAASADEEPLLLADGPPAEETNGEPRDVSAEEPALLMDGPEAGPLDPVQMVAEELDVPLEWVENVRHRLMRLDPVGTCARDLRECLLVQLEIWGYDDECLVYNMVKDHIEDIERRNYQAIAKAYDVEMKDIGESMKIIEALEPRPARNYLPAGQTGESQYITPDVYIYKVDDDYVISLNEDGLPKLKISPFYLEKLRAAERGDPSKSYIKEKMRSATWLIRSIHQRQRTIYKVVESIMKFQKDWFDQKGPLRPLILKEVADDIEMHESTVSRVTTRKYLHCHRGIFELKYFFNSSIATGDGASIASESVKDEIKKIIAGENPKKPFSDAAIVKILKEGDIQIARRTVAKYREMMGILPSNKRKQVF